MTQKMDELIGYLIDTAKASIEDLEDYMPTLVVDAGGRLAVIVLVGGHPYDMVRAAVPMLREQYTDIDVIAFTSDSYAMAGTDEDEMQALRARYGNSLQAAFEAGEPSVTETVLINVLTPTSIRLMSLPYTRTDDGIEWGEPHTDREGSGRMVDALKAVWE